jgi:alpha-glucoside transport system substrate-binding protein
VEEEIDSYDRLSMGASQMMSTVWRRRTLTGILVLLLAACSSPAAQGPGAPTGSQGGQRIGGTVNVLATWGGDEQESFLAMVRPFEEQTGVRVQYEATRDLNAVLTTRLQGGNPPDVAGLPGPGQMAELARAGRLTDLGGVLDTAAMRQQYSEDWLKLGQVDGKQVGVFIKTAAKGLIWYSPKAFSQAGYQVPKTWDELMALSQRVADTGTTPWCIGFEAAAASGWPGTDWLEDIVLRQAGPDAYDQWAQGKIKWSSPEIRGAWETLGRIVADQRMVFGGRQGMLATNFGDAGNPLFTNPPRCYLHHQGSFITSFFTQANPALKPVEDFDFFGFPDVDARYAGSLEVAGDLFGMFKDTPQSRALIKYLATPEAQQIWVKRGGAISPNKQVPLDAYPDQLARRSAELLTGARMLRFDASDLMPEAMNAAFWKGILDFVNNPESLDSILSGLDAVQASAYRQAS